MKLHHANLLAWLLAVQGPVSLAASSTRTLSKRAPCTPLAQGYEMVDDSPAINEALKACGNGGIIVLPADQIYSIRTPINFSPCKNCDFQIEGRLIAARGQWDYWNSVDSIFTFAGTKGVRIRSVTGSGVVDGNAVDYYMGRWDSGYSSTKAFGHITNGSSDISVENLTMKNVMHRFFRAEGQSNNISFSNLKLSMEQQWCLYPRNEFDSAGLEFGNDVTDVKVSNIDMSVKCRSDHSPGVAGICVTMDIGTHNVEIRDFVCKGAWSGVLVTLDSIGTIRPTAAQLADTVSNVYVSNLTFDGGSSAAGFRSGWYNSTMRNITWDGVTVINYHEYPASGHLCWMKTHSFTGYFPNCMMQMAAKVTDVWFKNFRGKLPSMPAGPGWEHINNMTVTEYHFEGWQNSTV